jgi:hypothetical protein
MSIEKQNIKYNAADYIPSLLGIRIRSGWLIAED